MSDTSALNPPFVAQLGSTPGPEFAQQLIQAAMNTPGPKTYANGTALALTATDVVITALWNNIPVSMVTLAISTAKGLAADLSSAVAQYEVFTGSTVRTLAEISNAMQQASEKDRAPGE
jgi:hypothetical protein